MCGCWESNLPACTGFAARLGTQQTQHLTRISGTQQPFDMTRAHLYDMRLTFPPYRGTGRRYCCILVCGGVFMASVRQIDSRCFIWWMRSSWESAPSMLRFAILRHCHYARQNENVRRHRISRTLGCVYFTRANCLRAFRKIGNNAGAYGAG